MNIFEMLPTDIQETLTTNAGVMYGAFDPDGEINKETLQKNILFATTGGNSFVCKPNRQDYGEDIDNCPKGSKEMMKNESYDCRISGTALTVKGETLQSFVGSADISKATATKIKPRMDIKTEDFVDRWLVVPYGTQGGFIAVKLMNAISEAGLSGQTADKNKGSYAFEFSGHPSITKPEEVPFEIYIRDNLSLPAKQVKV